MLRFVFERQDVEACTVALGVRHPVQTLKELRMARCRQALLLELDHPLLPCPAQLPVGLVPRGKVELARHAVSHPSGAWDKCLALGCLDERCQVGLFARELYFLQGIDDGADRLLVLQDISLNGFMEQQSSKGIPLHRARHSSFHANYN